MTHLDDRQLLERFERRIATIEAEIPPPPSWSRAAGPAVRPATRRSRVTLRPPGYVLAGAIVVLIGGLLLAGLLTAPTETRPAVGAPMTPGSTSFPPIQLPAEIPAAVESGTLETPLGQARWVHLSGNDKMLPQELSALISTPDGYVVPELDGAEAKLWRSTDLIGWISEPLGIDALRGDLSRARDAYWLNVAEPRSLWRSKDLKSWERVSLERLIPPGPDGYAWSLWPGRPLTYGGVTLVPFTWGTDGRVVIRGLLGADDVSSATLVETAPGVFAIEDWVIGADNRGTFVTVHFEETDDGLRVLDHETGTELKVLEGVSMEFIKRLAFEVESRFDEIPTSVQGGIGIVQGGELVDVELPLGAEASDQQAFTVDESGFASYTLGPDGLVHVHRSQDGRAWRETDVIGDDPGEPTDFGSIYEQGESVHIESGSETLTTDGLGWEPQRPPVPLWTDPTFYPIGTGWLLGPLDTNPVTGVQEVSPGNIIPRIWYQPAEGEPVPIDITEMDLPINECGGGTFPLSPNTIATHFDEDCTGVRHAWIITFDDVPA